MTNVELAERVGLTAPPCLRRVRALELAGAIRGYHAQLDSAVLGYPVTVFAMVSLTTQAESALSAFEAHVAAIPEVRECHMLNGEIDFILKLVAPDLRGVSGVADAAIIECAERREREDLADDPHRQAHAGRSHPGLGGCSDLLWCGSGFGRRQRQDRGRAPARPFAFQPQRAVHRDHRIGAPMQAKPAGFMCRGWRNRAGIAGSSRRASKPSPSSRIAIMTCPSRLLDRDRDRAAASASRRSLRSRWRTGCR